MSRRARRYVHASPDLTSLLDTLFILMFAALIRTAAVQQAAAKPAPPPPPEPPKPAVKLASAELQARALADLGKQLASRPYVVVRVAADGRLTGLELDDKTSPLDTPLLEHSPDPDIGLAYLGDRSAELRVCRIITVHLNLPDLARHLVIIAPDKRLADLPHALYEGLRRDIDRCVEQKGLAVLVDPVAQSAASPTMQPEAPKP